MAHVKHRNLISGHPLKITIFLALVILGYFPAAIASELDRTMFKGHELVLFAQNGQCALSIDAHRKATLGVGLPCYFQRNKDSLQHYTFPEFSGMTIIAIIGTPITDDLRADYKLAETAVCLRNAQGVALNEETGITIVEQMTENGLWCRNTGVDRKFLYDFAERAVQQTKAAPR